MSFPQRKVKTAWTCRTCKQQLYLTRLGNIWCIKCNQIRNYKYIDPLYIKMWLGRGRTTVGRKKIMLSKRGRRLI